MKVLAHKLIKKIEKYTKIDVKYAMRGSFWLTIGYAIQILSSLALTIAFANLLDKQSYGIYQYIMSGATVLGTLTLSGLAIAVKRSVAQGNEAALRYGFRKKLIWSISVVVFSGAVAGYYFFKGNSVLGTGFLIIGILTPLIESFSLYKSYLTGTKRFKESALLGFWRKPVVIITVLIALFLTDDPLILLATYFIANALSVGSLYFLVVHKYQLPTQKQNSDILSYGKHLSVLGIIGVIGSNADKILIFTTLGATEVAVYSFATLPMIHTLKLFGLLSNDLVFPKFANHTFQTIKQTIHKKAGLFFLASVATVITYILTAKFIFTFLFPAYPEAVLLSQIAILALLTKAATLYGIVLTAHKYEKLQYFLTTSTTIIKLVALLYFIPIYGVLGAIYAVLAAHIYWAITVTILFYTIKNPREIS